MPLSNTLGVPYRLKYPHRNFDTDICVIIATMDVVLVALTSLF